MSGAMPGRDEHSLPINVSMNCFVGAICADLESLASLKPSQPTPAHCKCALELSPMEAVVLQDGAKKFEEIFSKT